MAKKNTEPENLLTPSGHQVDKDLIKVPIKVSPSMQALIANQIDLLDMLEGKISKDNILIEQHRVEVLQVEAEIAQAFSGYVEKKEKSKEQRLKRKTLLAQESNEDIQHPEHLPEGTAVPFDAASLDTPPFVLENQGAQNEERLLEYDMFFDIENSQQPPKLPSDKYAPPAQKAPAQQNPADARRVALGAAIKALQSFLERELNEAELQILEKQVDFYLS